MPYSSEIIAFWGAIGKYEGEKDKHEHVQSFTNFWRHLPDIYRDLKDSLTQPDVQYGSEGMAYRAAAENLRNGAKKPIKIALIGLNYLSRAELAIFDGLSTNCDLRFLWDIPQADEQWRNNKIWTAAGQFIDKAISSLPNAKHFRIANPWENLGVKIAVSPQGGRAQQLAALRQVGAGFGPGVSILYADDSLHKLGQKVALGQGLGLTQLHPDAIALLELAEEFLNFFLAYDDQSQEVELSSLLSLMGHDCLSCHQELSELHDRFLTHFAGRHFVSIHTLKEGPGVLPILGNLGGLPYLESAGNLISQLCNFTPSSVIYEILRRINIDIDRLGQLHQSFSLSPLTQHSIFKAAINAAGEAFHQADEQPDIFGSLGDTRGLDLRSLIVIGATDELFPGKNAITSLLPNSIRQFYGLPTPKDRQTIDLYHFHRLLPYLDKLCFIYHDSLDAEPSHFIRQLQFLHPSNFEAQSPPSIQFPAEIIKPIQFAENGLVKSWTLNKSSGDGISFSHLQDWGKCKLKFYYRYIEKLRPESTEHSFPTFTGRGNTLHKALEMIVSDALNPKNGGFQAFISNLSDDMPLIEKYLLAEADKNLAERLTPLELIESKAVLQLYLEEKLKTLNERTVIQMEQSECAHIVIGNQQLRIAARPDRVDSIGDDTICLVDYKYSKEQKSSDETEMAEMFEDNSTGDILVFQLAYYALVKKLNGENRTITGEIHSLKELKFTQHLLHIPHSPEETRVNAAESFVIDMLKEMLLEEHEISQTSNFNHCKYCDYKNICMRPFSVAY